MGQLDTSYTPAKQADATPQSAQKPASKPAPEAEPVITDYASI